MNRSILIVICDFLLVSLLAFSSVDINKVAQEGTTRQLNLTLSTNQPDSRQDLAAVMRLALNDEQKYRDRLLGQLIQTRTTLEQTRTNLTQTSETLEQRQAALKEREEQVRTFQKDLQAREQQAVRLQQERALLQEQFAAAQTNIQNLQQQLRTTTTEALISKEKLAATEVEVRRQQAQASALEQRLTQVAQSNQVVLSEKQQLATQLQVAEAEKRASVQQLAQMQQDLQVARDEKNQLTQHADKLADGVKVLASKSGELAEGVKVLAANSTALSDRVTTLATNSAVLNEGIRTLTTNSGFLSEGLKTLTTNAGLLTKEIRENRALTPNTIFNEFSTNRVHARFYASRTGMLGIELNRRRETEMVLASDGTNTFALCHVEDTPLTFENFAPEWERITGTLSRDTTQLTISGVSFALLDPRVVLIPLAPNQVRDLGCRPYRICPDPFKFQEAVIVGAREGYYGECKFQIDLNTPQYVKMDRNLLKGLFGKFNPSRGDLVFSKTGDLLGVMANGTYCVLLHHFKTVALLQFGQDLRPQHPESVLSQLYWVINWLPEKLR